MRTRDEELFTATVAALTGELGDDIALSGAWIGEPGTMWVVFRRREAPEFLLGARVSLEPWAVADDAVESGIAVARDVQEVGWIATDADPRVDQCDGCWIVSTGAIAARPEVTPAGAARTALLVAFDVLVASGHAGILAEGTAPDRTDPIVDRLSLLLDADGAPVSQLLCAAWRAALQTVVGGTDPARARRAFAAISIG